MNCPNCGLANPDTAKFCANCGTQFGSANAPAGTGLAGNSMGKNIGIGCLIVLVILVFFGLSCTRACFGLRHRSYIHRRY